MNHALTACDPEKNQIRAWRVDAGRDLLGQWEAAVSFGRIGARGRRMAPKLFGDEARMRSFIREGLRRRRSARRRIGVDYRVVDASEAGWDMLHSLRLA